MQGFFEGFTGPGTAVALCVFYSLHRRKPISTASSGECFVQGGYSLCCMLGSLVGIVKHWEKNCSCRKNVCLWFKEGSGKISNENLWRKITVMGAPLFDRQRWCWLKILLTLILNKADVGFKWGWRNKDGLHELGLGTTTWLFGFLFFRITLWIRNQPTLFITSGGITKYKSSCTSLRSFLFCKIKLRFLLILCT